ncbi:MAG TPA: ABC transporter permease, partial [Candidatus Sulfopaludibacter sp.]|nr:ABC transporter permease [Candidatus Sulfopaludibacter sp.]
FAVADAVLLQPLAYNHSGQLLLLRERLPTISSHPFSISAPDIPLLHEAGTAFTGVEAFQQEDLDLAGAGEATRVVAARISAGLFRMLGAQPRLGANFTPTQDRPGQYVVIVSDALWRRRLGGEPHAVGRQLRLEGQDYTVVGVMPPGFEFPPRGLPGQLPAELWVPMALTPQELSDVADNFDFGVIARLKPGATLNAARAQMAVAAGRVRQFWTAKYGPAGNIPVEVTADRLGVQVVAGTRTMMMLLLAAAALLLLMSCANVINLFLVRTSARRHELAMRAALGASRGRLVRQGLTEAWVLALGAGGVGAALAWGLLRGLTAAAPASLPQVSHIGLGGWAPLAALALTLAAGLICGLLPALMGTRELHAALRESSPTLTHARRESRWRVGLTIAQVAIAFVLVCGAGLLLRSFIVAETGGAGVRAVGVISAALPLPQAQYSSTAADLAFYRRLQAVLGAQPGVVAVAEATDLPTQADWNHIFTVENQKGQGKAALPITIQTLTLGNYFRALGIPLLQGRDFTASESQGKANVVIVSAALA